MHLKAYVCLLPWILYVILLAVSHKKLLLFNINGKIPAKTISEEVVHRLERYHHAYFNDTFDEEQNATLSLIPTGRFGNRMFQYAALIGIAWKNRLRPVLPPYVGLQRCFRGVPVEKGPDPQEVQIFHPKDLYFGEDAFRIGHNYSHLRSLMQSWKYFGHVEERVRKYYTFHPEIDAKSEQFLSNIRGNSSVLTFVSIHVRRTDFIGEYHHLINPITVDFIHRAMEIFWRTFYKVRFIVVSDDINWCKSNLKFGQPYDLDFSTNNTDCEDLSLLSKCNHSIITPGSTFSYWGALLSGGHVIYYPGWLKHGSWYNLKFVEEDIFLPRWTPIPRILS